MRGSADRGRMRQPGRTKTEAMHAHVIDVIDVPEVREGTAPKDNRRYPCLARSKAYPTCGMHQAMA